MKNNFWIATGLLVVLAGCAADKASEPSAGSSGNSDNPNRYAFSTERDPQRGEVVKIFDEQTGDYWIKWVGTDPAGGKVYSIWNYFPLQGQPKSGLTEMATLEPDERAADSTAQPQESAPVEAQTGPEAAE